MTRDEMETLLQQEVKGLDTYLDPVDYSNAVDDATRDTGFSFPTSTDFQIMWLKQRAKRAIFWYLLSESAHKFKYEQINLQQRFEHYRDIIKYMDEQYEKALEDNPDQFAGVNAIHFFGTKIDAGFRYEEETGRDLTYDTDSKTLFNPTEND
jgi:hypothetical protein